MLGTTLNSIETLVVDPNNPDVPGIWQLIEFPEHTPRPRFDLAAAALNETEIVIMGGDTMIDEAFHDVLIFDSTDYDCYQVYFSPLDMAQKEGGVCLNVRKNEILAMVESSFQSRYIVNFRNCEIKPRLDVIKRYAATVSAI